MVKVGKEVPVVIYNAQGGSRTVGRVVGFRYADPEPPQVILEITDDLALRSLGWEPDLGEVSIQLRPAQSPFTLEFTEEFKKRVLEE